MRSTRTASTTATDEAETGGVASENADTADTSLTVGVQDHDAYESNTKGSAPDRHLSTGTTLVDTQSARRHSACTSIGSATPSIAEGPGAARCYKPRASSQPTAKTVRLSIPAPVQTQNMDSTLASNASSTLVDGRFKIRMMRKRHDAIQRQLRLQFIYPVVYFLAWLVPFANHVSLYNPGNARRPMFGLALAAIAFQAAMGLIDFMVFSIRERPWAHIPGSDGTFWGSFCFWSHKEMTSFMISNGSSPNNSQNYRMGSIDRVLHLPRRNSALSKTRHTFGVRRNEREAEGCLDTSISRNLAQPVESDKFQGLASWDFARGRTDAEDG